MKKVALFVALCLATVVAGYAQEQSNGEVLDDIVEVGLRAGHNTSFGGFAALSVQSLLTFGNVGLSAGVQYNTIGKTAVEARPAYIKAFSWGEVSAEALFAYTNIASTNSISAGVGVGLLGKWIGGKLGYYYRVYGNSGDRVQEPFNIYYELRANLLPKLKRWMLQLVITNSEIFELERHYQPTFIAQCGYCLNDYLGISMGVGCKPAGMFNLSADYYQSFFNLGVCYGW